MKLIVLGKYGPYPKGNGACSGYIIEYGNSKLLLDCGNGVLSRYFELGHKIEELSGIIISHFHPDHFSDLLVLRYAAYISKLNNSLQNKIPLYCPEKPIKYFEEVNYKGLFEINVINDKQTIYFNTLKIAFNKTNHSVECYSTTIYNDDKKFVYTGDTAYFEEINEIVKECDLLLCEGGILQNQKNNVSHLSTKEACEIAQNCNVKRLILTHIDPQNNDEDIFKEGIKYYKGILEVAKEKSSYTI